MARIFIDLGGDANGGGGGVGLGVEVVGGPIRYLPLPPPQ